MRPVSFEIGEVVYREGDASDCVYFVESGAVEVRRGVGPDEVTLATLGKGEILGEMGVIRQQIRSTSIVAAEPTVLLRLEGKAFLKAFGGPDGLGLALLRMICDRLTGANKDIGGQSGPGHAMRQDIGEIRLLGASQEMRRMLGPTGVLIERLPFEIGLGDGPGMLMDPDRIALPLEGPSPQLGRRHLRIERASDGRLVVRDLESKLGSVVNGKRISSFERMEQEPVGDLIPGDNELVAGGVYSPVRFILRLRAGKARPRRAA